MKHYRGVEGLRAWLAWTVVLSHICAQALRSGRFVYLDPLVMAGDQSVQLFIIISGFVITHLVLSRQEPYPAYIIRRFLRIYPTYFVCLIAGIFTTTAYLGVVEQQPWGAMSPPLDYFGGDIKSLHADFWPHLAAHVLLLHGLISDTVLYHSSTFFVSPAWSLSLEWQFYLLAPFAIAGLRHPLRAPALICIVVIGAYLYNKGVFGQFGHPSSLPGAGPLFALGIFSRLGMDAAPRLRSYPLAPLLLVLGILLIFQRPMVFLGVWLMLVFYLLLENPQDALSRAIEQALHQCLDSPTAVWLGQRSYATYLVHFPIMQATVWVLATAGLGYWASFAAILVCVPVFTVIASAALYRHVEIPGIALGRKFAGYRVA